MENAVRKLSDHKLYTIGQVLTVLKPQFGDLTPSKLRFLEDQGLLTPERTDAGYRKYSENQIERLSIILTLQRDQYLPLKVIKDYRAELDAGRTPILPTASPANLRRGRLGEEAAARHLGSLDRSRTPRTRLKLHSLWLVLSFLEFNQGT